MCGIAGIINLGKNASIKAHSVMQMTESLKHRGPDDEGFLAVNQKSATIFSGDDTPQREARFNDINYYPDKHITTVAGENFYLCFGHRRLSIVDLSYRGHQPMCDHSGLYWITYNGEVYNHAEVKAELGNMGYRFRSNTDTEVILNAYIQWGADCLQKFNGMFAFAIYNTTDQTVFLARDRVGIKPLYYSIQNDHFIFASEIKAIIKSGLYKPEVNFEGLWHNLSFNIAPRPMTCFKNVFALEQAHWMQINLNTGVTSKQRYWDIPTGPQDFSVSENEAAEMLEAAVTKSIKYRLIADVEVGTFMSGGVDSTTVSAIANKLHKGIKAFTLGFDKSISEYNEMEEAKENARINNLNHVIKYVEAKDIIDHIEDAIAIQEEPYSSIHPDYVLSRVVSENKVKVILNGLGPDELMAGYKYYTQFNIWKIMQGLRFVMKLMPHHNQYIDILKELSECRNVSEYYYALFSNFQDSSKRCLFPRQYWYDSKSVLTRLYNKNARSFSDRLQELGYFDFMNFIGNHHVSRSDLNTMRFSIEARFPFLDHNVVELAFKLPARFKINHGVQKYLLRQIARKYISPRSLTMKKRGFGLPVGRWAHHELQSFTMDSLQSLKKRGIFNPVSIARIYESSTDKGFHQLWHLVTVEQWFQEFIDKAERF